MIRCDRCSGRAVIFQKYSGKHLCSRHFEEDVHRKVKEVLRTYRIFGKPCRIVVAVSGGKDSTSLLAILHGLFSSREDVELLAVSIDEGIDGYRPKTISAAASVAKQLGIEHVVERLDDNFGVTTDLMAAQGHPQGPCSFCGVLRKGLLNRTARNLGANAVATGHNLDDEAQTVMLNYLKGDVDRLYRLRPKKPLAGMVPRIKPLRRIPEKEMGVYAITHGIPIETAACPYISRAMRQEVKDLLNDLEAKHPGTKYSIMRGFEKILARELPGSYEVVACTRCGEPSSDGVCASCRLLEMVCGEQSL
ncbi:MAG TPA: TIGR00269 family protein [Methanothrix sp.]|nr:TIGR00269 family protein [Methanothrix sp.]HRW82969.1 TIGR00269 family protein [Methanothrix sp.]